MVVSFIGLAIVVGIVSFAIYAEFFDTATPGHKYLTPEEMGEVK